MTAAEKVLLTDFLDTAAAVLGNGYRNKNQKYHFSDDPEISIKLNQIRTQEQSPLLASSDTLEKIAGEIKTCQACGLCTKRKNAVPGEGAQIPLVTVIGEGPGADEDACGRPFVGKAGQLLDKMLASIGLSRETNCFIANVIKCRPPANRDPLPEETIACASFLKRQLQILNPGYILCCGRIAAQALSIIDPGESLGKIRGRLIDYKTGKIIIPLIATYHPAALLRNEELKRPAWEDLKLLRSFLENKA